MGKLYRRKGSPYWWGRWEDASGTARRESTRTRDRSVATLWLSAREAETIKTLAGVPHAKAISLADAVGLYLSDRRPPVWSGEWWETVFLWFKARITPMLGAETIVSGITKANVESLRVKWLAGTDENQKVQPPTVNRLTSVGSGFFKWAIRHGYALDNPFRGHPKFPEPPRDLVIPDEETIDLLLAALGPGLRRAATVMVDTGLRNKELRRIRLEDIDHKRKRVHVVSSYHRSITKTGQARWVPLTDRAYEALVAASKSRTDGHAFGALNNVYRDMKKACAQIGLPRLRWYDHRHMALTRMANEGLRGHDLKEVAGWRSLEMANRYLHPNNENIEAAVRRLGRKSLHTSDTQPAHSPDEPKGPKR